MVGPIQPVDAVGGLGEGQLVAVDLLAAGHHPGDGAEAGGDARRMGVDEGRQGVFEHFGVELEGLAVGVHIGARIQRLDQRRAHLRRGGEDLVDETVFGPAQGDVVEARGRLELGRVVGAAVGRGEDRRQGAVGRPLDGVDPIRLGWRRMGCIGDFRQARHNG